ncbi:MAG: hypothetical protein OXU19_14285 [bacterium]|nr:hypothetical protein [bacterium]MDE0240461.1 hypothetical protein [bacterium]MDE0415384.1 hypothetical protein [bacterium]
MLQRHGRAVPGWVHHDGEVDYPQLFWEEAPEYADALGRSISKAISGELTSQQTLDEAVEEWVQIAQHRNFIDGAPSLGYKI